MITSIHIKNFKVFQTLDLPLNGDLNVIVGNNEAGKSTILEAIALALTKRINGKTVEYELSSHLFNKQCTLDYLKALAEGRNPEMPMIEIELYFSEVAALAPLRGQNNSKRTDEIGLKLTIEFDDQYAEEYGKLLDNRKEIKAVPVEYYKVGWYGFSGNAITSRSLPIAISNIDATTIRLQSGADYFLQDIIAGSLDSKEKVALAVAYRNLKEKFSAEPAIDTINKKLTQKQGAITTKNLAIAIDTSQKTHWENALTPHLDELPFQFIGKGEQSALKIMLALERQAKDSNIILIEEPENHLSFSSMSVLLEKICEKCKGKQIIIVTHSAYVLNKLGLEKLTLLHNEKHTSLAKLPAETYDYFKKLSGYDTLRLILAKRTILVEGPSDELIVQKAFLTKYGKLPLGDGVDVINVRGLSFPRFLDIAKELAKPVAVVTDNDGDYENRIIKKYLGFGFGQGGQE
ncbi:MAG: AAA family ATPase [Verrucomicrobiota bacterium]